MNKRQKKKAQQNILLLCLQNAVTELDKTMFQEPHIKTKPHYKVRVKRIPSHEAIAVYNSNNLKIEVRSKEGKHGRPHFHVKVKQEEVSIALDNFEVLAGGLGNKYMKTVLAWAEENISLLRATWEQFHGAIVQVT